MHAHEITKSLGLARKYMAFDAGADASGRAIHRDRPMERFAVQAFNSSTDGLVGDMLYPLVPNLPHQSDEYYVIEKDAFLRLEENGALRAKGTSARRKAFTISSDTYFAPNYALAAEIPVEDLANQDRAINLRRHHTLNITLDLKRQQELRIANQVTSISNVGSGVNLTGTAKWSDYSGSDPVADVRTGQAFIRTQTGLLPNVAIIDWDTVQVLTRHPLLLEMFKYVSGGELTLDQLAKLFQVQKIGVANSIRNAAPEGQDFSSQNIWGNVCVLAHVQPGVDLMTMTLGLRMGWRAEGSVNDMNVIRSRYDRAGEPHIEVLETGHYQDEKIVARDLGYTISGTL